MQFRDIIGQTKIINKMIRAIKMGRIAHAQLFLGLEGSQKLALAIAYSQYLNCKNRQTFADTCENELLGDSCGLCPSCFKIKQLVHPDLVFIFPNNTNDRIKKDAKSTDFYPQWRSKCIESHCEFSLNEWYAELGIGNKQGTINTRDCNEILRSLSFTHFEADYKVVIIWMVEKLYHTAAPRLLKTLEEPHPKTVFILIAEDADQILNTIQSRCQTVKIPKIEPIAIENFLNNSLGLDRTLAHKIAIQANGNLLSALHSSQNSEEQNKIHSTFVNWLRLCYSANIKGILDLGSQCVGSGRENMKLFYLHALNQFRLCLLQSTGNEKWIPLEGEEKDFVKKFSQFINHKNINDYCNLINEAIVHTERNGNGNMIFLDVSLKICSLIALVVKEKKQ